ncbi:hypothetical protein V491_08851 [Pseudogymnoascus sp. VKM F-3775]|nr:hypothetical protein V491_08851 [Pseudogymnoascus sp. VKM F-3775]
MAPSLSPARSSRFSSVASIFSRFKTKTPTENKSRSQDLKKARQEAPVEQQEALMQQQEAPTKQQEAPMQQQETLMEEQEAPTEQQEVPVEGQVAKVKRSGGVRFENIKVGNCCAIAMVSDDGEVYGKGVEVGNNTTINCGQISQKLVQSLPRAYSPGQSPTENPSSSAIESGRHGVGHVLGVAAPSGGGRQHI